MQPIRNAIVFTLVAAVVAFLLEIVSSSDIDLSPTFMAIFLVTVAMRHAALAGAALIGSYAAFLVAKPPPHPRASALSGAVFGASGYAVAFSPMFSLSAWPAFAVLFALAVLVALAASRWRFPSHG
jgi:hypothetical protein